MMCSGWGSSVSVWRLWRTSGSNFLDGCWPEFPVVSVVELSPPTKARPKANCCCWSSLQQLRDPKTKGTIAEEQIDIFESKSYFPCLIAYVLSVYLFFPGKALPGSIIIFKETVYHFIFSRICN